MAKKKSITVYKCSECGYTQPTWLGRCPECGSWNTLEECISDPNSTAAAFGQSATEKIKPVPLANVTAQENARVSTEIGEFDRVLGGGAMKRSAILIGGEPGIGKSTLMIQTAAAIAKKYGKVLYVSGEENEVQCITLGVNFDIQLDSQPFFSTNNFTKSVGMYGTFTINFATYLTNTNLINKALAVALKDLSKQPEGVNTNFNFDIVFKNGFKINNVNFKLVNFSIQQNLGEMPVASLTFTN